MGNNDQSGVSSSPALVRITNTKTGKVTRILSPIVPARIKVEGATEEIVVNCALDKCSSDCWIREDIQGVPEFFEQNVTKCSLELYKHIEVHKGISESV